jgi:NTE family protein
MKFLMDVVFKFLAKVGGNFEYSKESNKTYEGLRDNALNAVILDTKDVGTLSFAEAQSKAEYLHIKGSIQTARYFENHGIGANPDKNLDRKEFMLKVFEETQSKGIISKWKDKILGGKEKKSNDLLSFCKPESWTGKNQTEILSGFVVAAATSRSDGKLTSGTATMNKMVDMLNDPSTPSLIKKDFIDLLKVEVKQKKGQSKAESVVAYKFKTADFDGLLNKIQQDKTQSKTKPQSRKKENNVVGDILSSKRPKSHTDKLLSSSKKNVGPKTRG